MIKNTMVLKKGKMDISYGYYLLVGALLGACPIEFAIAIALLNLCVAYQKDIFAYLLFSVSLCICVASINTEYILLYGVFIVLAWGCMKGLSFLKLEVENNMTLWNVLFASLGTYYATKNVEQTLLISVFTFVIHYFYFSSLQMKAKQHQLIMLFSLLSIAYLLVVAYAPEYSFYGSLLYVIAIAYTMPFNICFFVCLYFSINTVPIPYLAFLLWINHNDSKRLMYSLCAWLFLLMEFNASAIVFAFVCSLAGMFSLQEEEVFMQTSQKVERNHELYMQQSFYKQLVHYSSIFYDLAKYYEDRPQQSQALMLMGEALEYNAKVSKNYFSVKEEMSERIIQTLKGYHFSILDCHYQEEEDKVSVSMTLENIYKNEMEEVILPLLEKVTQTRLQVAKKIPVLFHKERVHLVFENEAYLQVETYGASKKAHTSVSGDSFHTFQLEQGLVCMLSDGMGQGEKAQRISALLIKMMETMLRCDIPQVESVKLINQFLRSDMYATLDVLSFDRKKNKVYLSKSASAPTYLIREGELFEMSAHSLPIGIVDNIQANVFELAFMSRDIFIMTSDGVQKNEIEKWLQLKRCNHVKNEGLNLMNIINQTTRMDDSTIFMVKVK